MIHKIINKYKRARTNAWLSQNHDDQYAFVGMGQHSLNNLYPVLDYLHIPLKYICVTSEDKARLINRKFQWVKATTSINDILNDDSIKGVFVAATPSAHFEIAKKVIASRKSLFIEKPPCSSLSELKELIELNKQHPEQVIIVGLQKRFAPCTQILRKRLKKENIISYNLKYCTGAYPEGNALLDLYIHPIDLAVYLFGKASIIACEKPTPDTFILMLRHGDIVGTMELATSYSWSTAIETLSVCTQSGIYELSQMEELTYSPKQRAICGIPFEKVIKQNPTIEYLFSRNNFCPIIANNQIYTQGFYDEIKSFVDCVETKRISVDSFETLIETYGIIDKISKR